MGKRLMSVTKEGLKFGGDEDELDAKREKLYKEKFEGLTTYLKETYGETIEKIAISNRLQDTPCILVTSQYGYSANMERIMKSQVFSDAKKSAYLFSKKTLEINPRHPIIAELNNRVQAAGEDKVDEETKDLALVMLDTALLNSGFHMEDSVDFSNRMYRVMKAGLGLKTLELNDHIEVPAEPESDEDDEEELFDDDDEDEDDDKEDEEKEEKKEEEKKEEKKEEEAPAKESAAKDEL